jgi:4-amino-4-deoxy-L-arabinose transferase-like glycosyltransferase
MTIELTATPKLLPNSQVANRQAVRTLFFIFVGALAIGLAMVFVGFHMQNLVDTKFDPYDFGAMGKSVARGDGFAPFGNLIERRAPLYPLMIGAVYFLFGEQPTLVLVLQSVLLAGTCVLVFDIGHRLFNRRTGVIAAILCAFNPMLLRYVGDLQLETLLTFLFTAMVWVAVRFNARPTVGLGILVGASAALASLTKSVALPFPFFFAAIMIGMALLRRRRGERASLPVAPLAAMFVVLALMIAPWTARNYVATGGHFVLLSSGTSDAFLRGYIFSQPEYATLRLAPYEYAENASNELFRSLSISAGTTWMKDDYETDQILNRAAVQKLLADPGDFVRKFGVGILTFWYEMTSLSTSLVAGGLAVFTWLFAIVGLRRASSEGRSVWVLLLPALYLNVLLAALLALGRYSVPILPALLVVSAFGLDSLLTRWRPRHD